MSTSHGSVLSGAALTSFLDEFEEALELQVDAGLTRELQCESLCAALRRPASFRADSLESALRLCRLWQRAGADDDALAVLEGDGERILSSLPPDEFDAAALTLAWWRLHTKRRQPRVDPTELAAAFDEVQSRLRKTAADDDAWDHLAQCAHQAGDHERVRHIARLRHALAVANKDRATYRAWDDALLGTRLAASHATQGQALDAIAHARFAVLALAGAGADQDVDAEDWLRLADPLVASDPGCVDAIETNLLARLPHDISPADRRRIAVRLARLRAEALYLQGRLDDALSFAREGHVVLDEDEDTGDVFGARFIGWLDEAGRSEEAARLGFASIFLARIASASHACGIAQRELDAGAAGTIGALCALILATAMRVDALKHLAGDEDPERYRARYIDLAQRFAPDERLLGLVLARRQTIHHSDDPATLEALEIAARRCPELCTSALLSDIWLLRMRHAGVQDALQRPFIEAAGGDASYSMGVALDDLRGQLPEGTPWPKDAVSAMQMRYYESGLAQYELFFETGRSRILDGSAHAYSMLCNNLAIFRRRVQHDAEGAAVLHEKGIRTSPFSEHYDGLLECEDMADRHEGYVAAADRLWRFAATHGYSWHRPYDYIGNVVKILHKLDRDAEIPIWGQRMDEWWRDLDDDERARHRDPWLFDWTRVLGELTLSRPGDALVRLDQLMAEFLATGSAATLYNTAHVLLVAGRPDQAGNVYRNALAALPGDDDDFHRDLRSRIEEGIRRCDEGARQAVVPDNAAGRWWRFWDR